jgi:hypothetical protein
MKYHKDVTPFLNTTQELDVYTAELIDYWSSLDTTNATKTFLKATAISPNIGNVKTYVPHCLQVSRRCKEAGEQINRHYPDMIIPEQLEYAGLTEDYCYLIGGNGKNNQNGIDSNPYHEILTWIQLNHMGKPDLANIMAMHFVAPQILEVEQQQGRFLDVPMPKPNPELDILTAVDALCTTDYLPDTHNSLENALSFRITDIITRRTHKHPLVVALNNGGKERLQTSLKRLKNLLRGNYNQDELKLLYPGRDFKC